MQKRKRKRNEKYFVFIKIINYRPFPTTEQSIPF